MTKPIFCIPKTPDKPLYRWLLGFFMIAIIALGWKYPLLGFAVPVAMITGITGGLFRGRYVCGNICPRGSFYDTFFSYFGGSRPIPPIYKSLVFRWGIMVLLMGFMTWRIAANPSDWRHWGMVFWSICLITTAMGVTLGMIYRTRTWCAFCPVGTLAGVIGERKYRLRISQKCRQCGICEQACPMELSIARYKNEGETPNRDCIKCSSCMKKCPTGALSWPGG